MTVDKRYEVIIIGGSFAGLSAAMTLGRSLRSTLIIDSGKPCNRQTPHSHNFLTQDGKTPKEISTLAKQQALNYKTVTFCNDLAISGKTTDAGFEIESQSGAVYFSKKLIFATGIKDIMPDVKGFSKCWGISVIHCPYCHGYEFRDKKTGIFANGDRAFHLASLVKNLTNDITILTSGKPDLHNEQIDKLKAHHIAVVPKDQAEILPELL